MVRNLTGLLKYLASLSVSNVDEHIGLSLVWVTSLPDVSELDGTRLSLLRRLALNLQVRCVLGKSELAALAKLVPIVGFNKLETRVIATTSCSKRDVLHRR